ncbi:MAG: ABC transporter permease [Cyclobacteriaceae bacterium]
MIKNYLRVAFRVIAKNKSYVLMNTFGLGIAMACCITSYILLAYNIEFDDFHAEEKVKNTYRLEADLVLNDGDKSLGIHGPSPMAEMAVNDIAGINRFTRFAGSGANVSFDTNAFGEYVSFADSTFFDMFQFNMIKGNQESFKEISTIFINEEMAKKYFGNEDPIGKVLTLNFARQVEKNMIVRGVYEKMPVNSSLVFDAIIRFEHFKEMRELDSKPWEDWNLPAIFFELDEGQDPNQVADSFDGYVERRNEAKKDQHVEKYNLSHYKEKVEVGGNVWSPINLPIETDPVIVFIVLGVMILLIACFNLTNTSIALTSNRLKEIGLRKSIGAQKEHIIGQFLLETVLIVVLSLLVGAAVSQIIVPEFIAMWDLPYDFSDMKGVNVMIMLMTIVCFVSILTGLYPALFSTRFNTINLLKGNIRIKGTNLVTRALVTVQFAISVIVLVGGVVFMQNTRFQQSIRLGYDTDKLLVVNIQGEEEINALLPLAQSHPKIESIAYTNNHVGGNTYPSPVEYESVVYEAQHLGVGKNYFETIGFEFLQGRPFDVDKTTEFEEAVVVSKQFLATVGIQDDPIGKQIIVHSKKRRIVGVIDDFVDNVYRSRDAEPFVFYAADLPNMNQMIFRGKNSDLTEINEFIETNWKKEFPTKPFNSNYQEDMVTANFTKLNTNLQNIFLFLTILGAILSASGIYSLASLNIAKRTKEIGIRKALGASVSNIMMLINKEFFIILVMAGIFGAIGGYFGSNSLLDLIYAYHVTVDFVPLFFSALFIFLIGIGTTSFTIYRGAKANPADTLRDE